MAVWEKVHWMLGWPGGLVHDGQTGILALLPENISLPIIVFSEEACTNLHRTYADVIFDLIRSLTTTPIPRTQVAAVVPTLGAKPEIRKDVPVKQPSQLAPGECLIKIICTDVCHSDLHASHGNWPVTAVRPLIGGHEGVRHHRRDWHPYRETLQYKSVSE
ncbi:hypothetical protein BKA83DRAFT_4120694 [Pisolithus microcarpus]|nr:hypothetical protein BKA83DRAFT_4120694 [Pisolithus microcarpus]